MTGGAGFLGSHVVDELLRRKDIMHDGEETEVVAVDNLTTGREAWCACPLDTVDFFAAAQLRVATAIIHCAALADISENWTPNHNREHIFRTNVQHLHYMLEQLARGAACRRFIFISTAAVDAPQQTPYTASKIAGEALVRAYCQALNIHLTIVRPVSLVGKRYHHGHIADFVKMEKEHGVIRAKDNGHQRKPYASVVEAAHTIANMLHGYQSSEYIETIRGVAWGIGWTAELMKCPIEYANVTRGWTGDPDVDAFTRGDATPWFEEAIEWCRKEVGR